MVRVRLKSGGQSGVWKLPPIAFLLLVHVFWMFHSVSSSSSPWTPIDPVWEVDNESILSDPLYSSVSSPSRTFSPISSSPRGPDGEPFAKGILLFNAFGRTFRLLLRESEHLIHENFTTHHHEPDEHGESENDDDRRTLQQHHQPPLESNHLTSTHRIIENKIGRKGSEGCHWQGHLANSEHSRVALSTCPQLGGIIWDRDEVFHLHSNGTHSLISKSDDLQIPTHFKCGFNETKSEHRAEPKLSTSRRRRSRRGAATLTAVKRGPSGANAESRFVELVMVHDRRQFVKFGKDEKKLFDRSKQVANIVNALYAPLNIFVVLVGVQVWSQRDEIEVDPNAEKTLDNFLRYRMGALAHSMPNDNAQLVTDVTFEKDVVGKALKGPICTYQYSGGVNKDHHESVAVVAATIAHELGHNFGMEHDDVGQCRCPQSRCIMYPASNILVPPSAWSACSIEAIHETFAQHMDHCLRNPPKKIVGPSCGNGIVEEGEDCDCGPEHLCTTKCCDARTCTLPPTAICGHGECCDLETCRPKPAGFTCRASSELCDLPEHCDGEKPDCPADVFQRNGDKCGDGNAYCYMGSCSSHDMQCKKLWGPTGSTGHRSCFTLNANGTQIGNCGYDKIRKTFAKCKPKDIMCGTLHCTHLNERLEYGMLSAAKLSRFFLRTDRETHTCRSAVVDLGATDSDPGQAANGAVCGQDKACLDSRCVDIAQLESRKCEYGCFGHGVCNHLGHCHCDKGYGPPYCNFPGNGGSVDSGPTDNPDEVSHTMTLILSVIFLFVTPLVLFFISWTIFSKKDLMSKWRLRRRKLAVKHAARQGPLLNLYDKSQIPTPVAVGPRVVANGKSQQTTTISGDQNGLFSNVLPLPNGKPMVESKLDDRDVIRPARPAPPPPPGKGRPQDLSGGQSSNPPTEVGPQGVSAQHQGQPSSQQRNLKRTKSSGGSIRRPSAPPPPLPSAPNVPVGDLSPPLSPLYENMDTIRLHLVTEQRNNLRNSQDPGDEHAPLV